MKLSEMTMKHLALWCHVSETDERLPTAWAAAKRHILGATGLDDEAADERETLTFAAIALASDMIYNPGMHVDNDKINKVAESFIAQHDFNLLPGEA